MPVAKKGQNKSSGVTEALKAVLPNDLKKNFTLLGRRDNRSPRRNTATYAL